MSFLSDLRLSTAPEPSRAGGLSWLLAAFCLVSSASAQYRLDVWTTDDGLPQNGIRAIHQTPDGYLWLVTFDGLVRFDGIRFTVFNKSNSPGIDSNRFDSLYEDRNGELWLGTQDGGVTRYRHGSFTTYTTLNGLPTTMFEELPAMTPATCGSWRATPSCNGKRLPDDSSTLPRRT